MKMRITFALIFSLSFSSLLIAQHRSDGQTGNTRQHANSGNRSGSQIRGGNRSSGAGTSNATAHIVKEIRHELATLPYYGVFDWLEGQVNPDGTVMLRGQVVRPTTKSDAEARVRNIEGVTRVENQIETLPLSPQDDDIRVAVYRAIYNYSSPLFRYATQAVPPIHIIVNRGRVTLKGVVATESDSQLAYTAVRGVPGTFEVKNELQVESTRAR